MQLSDFTPALYLIGMVAFFICNARANKIRDPRDSDGRKLPRTGDEEGRARGIERRGQLVLAGCVLVAVVVGIIARPDSLLFIVGAAAAVLFGFSVHARRRRHRTSTDD